MFVNVVYGLDRNFGFDFLGIKNTQIFLGPIEVETADGFSIVVIDENRKVIFRITVSNSITFYNLATNGFDDVKTLEFFASCLDAIIFSRADQSSGHHRATRASSHPRLDSRVPRIDARCLK